MIIVGKPASENNMATSYVLFYKSTETYTGPECRYFADGGDAVEFYDRITLLETVLWATHIVPTAADGPRMRRIYKKAGVSKRDYLVGAP